MDTNTINGAKQYITLKFDSEQYGIDISYIDNDPIINNIESKFKNENNSIGGFIDLNINQQGRYTCENEGNEEIVEFPTGFFDSDLDELLEMA